MIDDDALLLQRLGVVAAVYDPIPAIVTELGRAAFGLRRLDDELAELVSDSDLGLVGVRSGGSDVRLLTFEVGELVVEAQISGSGDRHTILGQLVLVSVPEGTVRLETASHTSSDAPLDVLGGFRFDDVRSGPVRLSTVLPGARPVSTSWFSL